MKQTHDAMRQPPNAESSEPPRPIAETEAVGWQRSGGDGGGDGGGEAEGRSGWQTRGFCELSHA